MEIVILGSANAIPCGGAENTHFYVKQFSRVILVDCAGSPLIRIPQAGVNFDQIDDIVLTHFHPDHVSGVPSLLMGMWLLGRKKPMRLYGLEYTLQRLRTMMDLYDYQSWPRFFPLEFHPVAAEEKQVLIDDEQLRLTASPVNHLIPTIALRFDEVGGKSFTYSCDTAPCDSLVELARGSDLLLHEASGFSSGHSTASQAAEAAVKAGVKSLYLIHYPAKKESLPALLSEAKTVFGGVVNLALDFMRIEL